MDYDDILARYVRSRELTRGLAGKLTRMLGKATIEHAARQLGMWVKGTLVLGDMDEGDVLMDYAIHDCRESGRTVLERYVSEHPPVAGSEEEGILAAMRRAYFSLFQVERVLPGVGVEMYDLLLEERHLLVDVGFSHCAANGFVLATRVIPFADFVMTSGAPVGMDRGTLEAIIRLPGMREDDPDIAGLTLEARADLNAAIIRLCLGDKNTVRCAYEDVGEDEMGEAEAESVPEVVGPSRRVGRNDACPCGSGKKYKKCCGR